MYQHEILKKNSNMLPLAGCWVKTQMGKMKTQYKSLP